MSKVAHYLQEHLSGEVITNTDARKYFATDGSVFEVEPAIIVYPRNENDVRKATRFTWQLAERGRRVPITARGAGTDQSGAAIGEGIILVFPAHMNRILEFDAKTGAVTVEPGLNYGKMQQALFTHGKFLPPFPASIEYSTVGGAVGNNAGGDKSVKYGSTRKYVKSLRFVLANGEVIETRRLSKRELSRKMGLATFEGEIYRSIDKLIEENHDLVNSLPIAVTKNSAGYDLASVKGKGGSFDLTPLLVGSQGTLGVVTEIVLSVVVPAPIWKDIVLSVPRICLPLKVVAVPIRAISLCSAENSFSSEARLSLSYCPDDAWVASSRIRWRWVVTTARPPSAVCASEMPSFALRAATVMPRLCALIFSAMPRPAASSLALLTRRPDERRCREVLSELCVELRLRCAFREATLVLITCAMMISC